MSHNYKYDPQNILLISAFREISPNKSASGKRRLSIFLSKTQK